MDAGFSATCENQRLEVKSALVIVGLGANLPWGASSPRATLASAMGRLADWAEGDVQAASLYETAPVGPEQPRYLNTAAKFYYSGNLLKLLDGLQAIEAEMGRVRSVRWGPRTLDLDVLYVEGVALQHARLVIPHTELLNRAFAFLPLLELLPAPRNAENGETLRPNFDAVEADQMCKIDSDQWWK